jgi:hypothetical protein
MPWPRYAAGVRIVQLMIRSASVNQKINTALPPSCIFKTLHIILPMCEAWK